MSPALDPGICSLRWCEERADHDGPHRKILLDTDAFDVNTGKPVIVQLWLQGESARVKGMVLITGRCETGLTWPQAAKLGQELREQARMNG